MHAGGLSRHQDYSVHAPPRSFIDIGDFSNLAHVADLVNFLGDNRVAIHQIYSIDSQRVHVTLNANLLDAAQIYLLQKCCISLAADC
jgi:hypothetical protein